MRKITLAALCVVMAGAAGGPAAAEAKSLRRTYTDVRYVVVHKHGHRAAGRNIRRHGVKTPAGHRTATYAELAKSIRVLRALVHPRPFLAVAGATPPTHPPSMAMTASYAPTGKASCIVEHESHGDPLARNGKYSGSAQWSQTIWVRDGGLRYGATPTQASYQDQLRVLSTGLAQHGCSDWCPYDGC